MVERSIKELLQKIEELEDRLLESEHLNEAIMAGEVDAFAIKRNNKAEIYTLESSDYAYRVLVEESVEGALNVTEDGLIVYTNPGFCQILNVPYDNIIGSSITDFIHQDSIEEFKRVFTKALTSKSKAEIIIVGNGTEVPVYMSFTSLQPKLSTVGILVTDLTDKKNSERAIAAYQKRLESRNTTLIKMNTELQSFAHISSHDLQEPLRKIQIITARLQEEEAKNLSDVGKDLFRRMQNAAKRMQLVIEDLLAYSTTNVDKLKPEITDLNKIIDDLKEEFSEEFERKNALIESENLCSIKIIPVHFRQVLHNLISNSLKFSTPDKIAIIRINCSIGLGIDYNHDQLLPETTYCHIEYSDNGIGFDPLYNDKIFGLFQRLHSKEKYKGTGIGLAIVKKIIENHNGLIIADGKLNEGARFDIYLPQ